MNTALPGALVVSLDFELLWGVRDHVAVTDAYVENILGVRAALPRMLDVFAEFGIAATWATVGFLFARDRDELELLCPAVRPAYDDERLDPYSEPVGSGEADDPLHYGRSLIERIAATPRQEIASHTFSHYYCLEPGQDRAAFEADVRSAVAAARQADLALRSMVFPRNQHNPAYDQVLVDNGFRAYRGNPRSWMYEPSHGNSYNTPLKRIARAADSYMPFPWYHTSKWGEVRSGRLANVQASFFLRPFSARTRCIEWLRLQRLTRALHHAATKKEIVHLWWHPHNFGRHLDDNISFLRKLLETFAQLRESHGMRSLNMSDVATLAYGEE